MSKQIGLLSERVAKLEKDLAATQGNLSYFSSKVVPILPSKQVILDPSSLNKYSRLDLDNGFVLVSLSSADAYLDGVQVMVDIGNPLEMTYRGFKVTAKWGKRYDFSKFAAESWSEWSKSLRAKEEDRTDSLLPGSWTHIKLLLPDTKTTEFGYLELAITTNNILMRQ